MNAETAARLKLTLERRFPGLRVHIDEWPAPSGPDRVLVEFRALLPDRRRDADAMVRADAVLADQIAHTLNDELRPIDLSDYIKTVWR